MNPYLGLSWLDREKNHVLVDLYRHPLDTFKITASVSKVSFFKFRNAQITPTLLFKLS